MSELYTNAPIQNRGFDPDRAAGSVLPILVAEFLQNRFNQDDTQRTDLWNNVLATEHKGQDDSSYRIRSRERLASKYKSQLLGRLSAPGNIMTDDAESFSVWGAGVTKAGLDNGTLTIETRPVHVCDQCDGTIAHAEVEISNGCVPCDSSDTHIEDKPVLVAQMDSSAWNTAAGITGDMSLSKHTPPDREIIVNKKRLTGLSLDEFGFTGEVVDPKIGLGLLALYAAESRGYDSVSIIAGRSSSSKNTPQLAAYLGKGMQKHPSLRVRGIARAPMNYLAYLKNEEVISTDRYGEILCDTLPPHLLTMKKEISPQTLDRIIFSKRKSSTIIAIN